MQDSNRRILSFMREALKPYKLLILGQALVAIILAVDLSLRPYILKIIVDRISALTTSSTADDVLFVPVTLYLSVSLLVIIALRVNDYLWLQLNSNLKTYIGELLMKRVMTHTITTFQNRLSGNLANKIKEVMSGTPDLLRLCITKFFNHTLALIIAIFAVWTINYKFSTLLSTWLIIFFAITIFFSKRSRYLTVKSAEIRSTVVGQMVDIISNIVSVQLFASQRTELKNLRKHLDEYVKRDQIRDLWFIKMFIFQGISFIVYQILCFILLIHNLKAGVVTLGDFALLITVNVAIVNYLWTLAEDIQFLSELSGNIAQGLELILSPAEIHDNLNAKPLQIRHGRITFKNVKFNYEGAPALFDDQSVIIEPGQSVGLVGYSGSGKSTFVNLILRLYDVTKGSILIDTNDIRYVTLNSLRKSIAMIPQNPSLFHRSIKENIRYGLATASDDNVMEAAKKAYAHEFIIDLPHGYDSTVGERGVKLSGGQRQRIAIARAILKNAPILILDEATSQLDSVTEDNIQKSLWMLMQEKTTIVIAHRLSTLLRMNRILVFDNGKIIEDGTHDALLQQNGLYKILWDAQVGGFLPE